MQEFYFVLMLPPKSPYIHANIYLYIYIYTHVYICICKRERGGVVAFKTIHHVGRDLRPNTENMEQAMNPRARKLRVLGCKGSGLRGFTGG